VTDTGGTCAAWTARITCNAIDGRTPEDLPAFVVALTGAIQAANRVA
jgi:hypothetical protein